MLGRFFGWIPLLFEPLANYYVPPIQPQDRLRPEHQPWQQIITGVYSNPPLIKIHDRDGVVNWSFQRKDVKQTLPEGVRKCLHGTSTATTEVKWMNNGNSIAAIYSHLALVISHTPDNPATDKLITFALCRNNDVFWNAHTVEPLPNNLFAVATTGNRQWDGFMVYNASAANPLMENPPPVQNITGLPAIHALIWDEQGQMLWAAGTDAAPDGSDPVPAYGTIVGYPWDALAGRLRKDDRYIYKLDKPYDIQSEWGKDSTWWLGFHDMTPIPGERKLLVSEDRGVHEFDVDERQFTAHYENVTEKYMPGFEVTTLDRHGYNGDGQWEELPYSDLKAFSFAADGAYLYVQSLWTQYRGFHVSLVVNGLRRMIDIGDEIYCSRWFENIDGWPKP